MMTVCIQQGAAMLRKSILIAFAFSSLVVGQAANAEDRDLGLLQPGDDKYDGLCNEHDGTNWKTPDGSSWGCSYEGGGGIMCDQGGFNPDTNSLTPPGCMETTREGSTKGLPWGLAGLLGLLGLVGLRNRERQTK
jgi:MYXO-CTERM domain-containing protein